LYYLDHLSIEGFRNYQHQKLRFHPCLNILVGENAQGKTNLLESIFYLSVNRSFRTRKDHELVNFKSPFFVLKGSFIKDEFKHQIQVNYQQNNRLKVMVNNNHVNRYDLMQNYPVVVFSPDDLQIISDGPSIRRRFINLEASRLNPTYLKELRDYQRVLNQRNHVLKEKKSKAEIIDQLTPWDHPLTTLGVKLIRTRIEIIKDLEKEAQHFFNKITLSSESLALDYASTIQYIPDAEEMRKQYYQKLMVLRDQELKRFSTLIGPHLDDIKIFINGNDARRFSSQGQKRTAALALKMGEVSLFKQNNNLSPIILLDDVFSELDSERKAHLLDFISANAGQCIITTAVDLSKLMQNLSKEHKLLFVHQGSIIDETIRAGY